MTCSAVSAIHQQMTAFEVQRKLTEGPKLVMACGADGPSYITPSLMTARRLGAIGGDTEQAVANFRRRGIQLAVKPHNEVTLLRFRASGL